MAKFLKAHHVIDNLRRSLIRVELKWGAEVAGVTFSYADSDSCSKVLDPGPNVLEILEFDSCSDSTYNHRSNRNLPMFLQLYNLWSLQDAKGLWQPRQSSILAGFILSLPRPDLCGSEQPIHRERPVATQHPLRNCVD